MKDPNRHFSSRDMYKANRYMEKGSTTLVLRKMSINASMRCHLTLTRVDTTNDKKIMNLVVGAKKSELLNFLLLVGMQMSTVIVESMSSIQCYI